jgi:hypothetical protein
MVHTRTQEAINYRLARSNEKLSNRQIIFRFGYRDREIDETISLIQMPLVLRKVRKKFPFRIETYVEYVYPGDVVVDSRGEGSFQRQTQ